MRGFSITGGLLAAFSLAPAVHAGPIDRRLFGLGSDDDDAQNAILFDGVMFQADGSTAWNLDFRSQLFAKQFSNELAVTALKSVLAVAGITATDDKEANLQERTKF